MTSLQVKAGTSSKIKMIGLNAVNFFVNALRRPKPSLLLYKAQATIAYTTQAESAFKPKKTRTAWSTATVKESASSLRFLTPGRNDMK